MTDDEAAGGPIRVLVADDHAGFRSGLRALLATLDDVVWVGEAATGEEALARTAALQPDVVLMDLTMPGGGGVAATRAITAAHPHVAVLVLTMVDDDHALSEAVRAGARGYILKGAGRSELARAVRAVAAGGAIFGASIARRALAAASTGPAPAFPELTARERDVLELVARGLPNADIAARIGIANKTVRNHLAAIVAKLDVRDRAGVIVRAREAGLGGERRRD